MVGVAILPGVLATVATLATLEITGAVKLLALVFSLLAGLATVIGILYGVKWKIAHAVEVKAREGEQALNEALEERIRTIAHERDELKAKLDEATETILDARKTIARLEPLEKIGDILELVTATFERLRDRQEAMHVENNLKADQRLQIVLGEIQALNGRAG